MKRRSITYAILFLMAAVPQLRADQAVVSLSAGGKTYSGVLNEVAAPASPTPAFTSSLSMTAPVASVTMPIPSPSPATAVTTAVIPQNVTEVSPGVWRTNAGFLSQGKCYAQMQLPRALKAGEHVRVTCVRKTNVNDTGLLNDKIFRAWLDLNGGYPNFWDGRGVGTGSNQIKCEEGTGLDTYFHSQTPAPWNDVFCAYPTALDQPVVEVREFWPCSGVGTKDGRVRYTFNGKVIFDRGQFIANSTAAPGFPQYFGPQCVIAGYKSGDLPANAYVEFSGIKLEIVPN